MSGAGVVSQPDEMDPMEETSGRLATERAAPETIYPRVAFQGEAGAFGEEAIEAYWSGRARALPALHFADVLDMVLDGRADCAVLPVWNSSIGEIETATSTLRQRMPELSIVNRVHVSVQHCLLALPGTSLEDVRHVGSHPAALAQCTRLFASHADMAWHVSHDTAGAARELAALHVAAGAVWHGGGSAEERNHWRTEWNHVIANNPPNQLAAIASERAAARYGLSVLLRNVNDDPENTTRFAVVTQKGGRRW